MSSNEEVRQNVIKWIDALRIGKYEQCRSLLHQGESYCCLGVGVESLHGADVWVDIGSEDFVGNVNDLWCYGSDEEYEVLYAIDREKLGLSIADQDHLTSMNDNGYSFDEIADWIEENILSRLGE